MNGPRRLTVEEMREPDGYVEIPRDTNVGEAVNALDCTFNRAELAAALGRMIAVLPQRTTLPVLSHVRMSPLDGGVLFEATDLSRWARRGLFSATPPADFSPLCVPLDSLRDAASDFPGLEIRLEADGDAVRVSSGTSRLKLPSLPDKEFPKMASGEGEGFAPRGEVAASAFLLAIARTLPFASTEMSKPAYIGVHLKMNGDGPVMFGCDGHRLSKELVGSWENASEVDPATIAASGAQAMLKFFAASKGLAVEQSSTRFRFTDESGASLIVPTLADPFPNVEQIIPREAETVASIDRGLLASALRRVKLIQKDDTHGLLRVACDFGEYGLRLHAESERGVADEAVDCEVRGPALRIGFNTPYLLEMLASLPDDVVTVEMTHPRRAALWRAEGSDGLRLVMPLQLL